MPLKVFLFIQFCLLFTVDIMASVLYRLYTNLTRKKVYDTENVHQSQLKRCLTVFDLTVLGT